MRFSIFDYLEYKPALKAIIARNGDRGYRKTFSVAGGFQPAYLSQILNGDKHLNVDQAEALGHFLSFDEDETFYFLLLVEKARTQSHRLRTLLDGKLSLLRESQTKLSRNIADPEKSVLNPTHLLSYYSQWLNPFLHMVSTLERGCIPVEVAERCGLKLNAILSALQSLAKMGLVERLGHVWRATHKAVHVDRDNPLHAIFQRSFQDFTNHAITQTNAQDINYVSFVSCSASDAARLQREVSALITEHRKQIQNSAGESVLSYSVHLQHAF